MGLPEVKFETKLNQNTWAIIVALLALGAAEHFHLPSLYLIALIFSWVTLASVVITLVAYTISYCKLKLSR